MRPDLPIPPIELRRTIGGEDPAIFDNPTGAPVYGDDVPLANYRSVLDFGCGCGRVARKLLLQHEAVPQRYLGLDLHRPSIDWCRDNLVHPGFEFRHLDIHNAGLNPAGAAQQVGFGTGEAFSLINAHSVFTHITEPDVEFYFEQCVSRLAPGGILRSTWFLFDKLVFPMMQSFQNCLYVNPHDLTNACIYDAAFVRALFTRHGLTITRADPPRIRGHQRLLYARHGSEPHVEFALDLAPTGLMRPPA